MVSSSQIMSNNILELKNVVFEAKILADFIDKNFKEFTPVEGDQRFEEAYLYGDHPFDLYRLNREVFSKSTPYTLFELPVDNIYAYTIDKDKYVFYCTVYLNKSSIQKITKQIGPPINLLVEELKDPEASPLINWMLDDLDILVSRSTFGSYTKRWKLQIRTTNVHHKELTGF